MSERRVVVTGIGTVNPLGNNVAETWEKASTGQSGVAEIAGFDASHLTARVAGEVKNFDYTRYFPEEHARTAKRMDRFVHYAEAALQEALAGSGLDIESDPQRIGICVGSGMGGMDAQHNNSAALATKGARRVSPFYIPAAIGNIASGFLSIIHGIKGPNLSVQTACATANHSLITGFMIIKQGMAEVMISGGSEAAVTELAVAGFANMRALATNFNDEPERASRPYDVSRDGFVIAEGAGVIILEEYEYAKRRGAEILCEIRSVGMSGDGHDLVIPEPEGRGAEQSMRMALDNGKITVPELGYINTHGTATPLGDIAESRAVHRLVGGVEDSLHVSSTKSMHGHLLGAAGAVEGIICIQAMKHGIVPPSINLEELDPEVPLTCINTEPIEKEISVALSNSFGFGGHNSSVAFAKI